MIANWDACPALWDLIRHEVDRRGIPGQFILTGSEQDSSRSHQGVPVFHSGIGRYALRRMRTMSLYETGEGDGSASLRSLMDGSFEATRSQLSIEGYAHAIYRGGWPLAMAEGEGSAASLSVARSYYGDLVKKDLFSIADLPLRKDPDRAHRLLRSLSRHVAGECPDRLLLEEARMDRGTLRKYLLALRRLFIVDDLPAWLPKLRSKTAVRRAPARHLCDPSLAVCALGLSPDALFLDMDLFRSLLKSLAAHELMVCADILGGWLLHYRDKRGLGVDAVLQTRDWRFALFQFGGWGEEDMEKAASTLRKVESDLYEKPMFSAILTTGEWGYRREDGIYVIPIASLRP